MQLLHDLPLHQLPAATTATPHLLQPSAAATLSARYAATALLEYSLAATTIAPPK